MDSVNPDARRPIRSLGPIAWLRKNLFSTWYNAILSLVAIYIIYKLLYGFIGFLLQANWDPVTSRRVGLSLAIVCVLFGISWGIWGGLIQTFAYLLVAGSALIVVVPPSIISVPSQVRIFFVINIGVVFIGRLIGRSRFGKARTVIILWLFSLPVVIVLLYGFAQSERLPVVLTTLWGGLMINLLLAAIGIAASFPVGWLWPWADEARCQYYVGSA